MLREEGGNREDTELCLMWLCRQGKACVDETVNPPLVKFGHDANITNIDKQTHLLKKQEIILKRKLHELDVEKVKFEEEAKDYLKKNMRPAVSVKFIFILLICKSY